MESMSHSQVAFSGFSTDPDLLRSSSKGGIWVLLKTIGRARFGRRRRDFTVYGKIGSADQDPDVKGDVLTHLSYFKPLKRSCSKLFWILRNPSCCVMMTQGRPNAKDIVTGMYVPKLRGGGATRDTISLLGALNMQ